ncbi:MAG: hypothetical protein ABS78_16705 [Phenylobacterium sp. SCN 70-31]|nr:MAG: hypothetical protein ABS78_16705 [Phenylobacterium sp. SCN 70-31]
MARRWQRLLRVETLVVEEAAEETTPPAVAATVVTPASVRAGPAAASAMLTRISSVPWLPVPWPGQRRFGRRRLWGGLVGGGALDDLVEFAAV